MCVDTVMEEMNTMNNPTKKLVLKGLMIAVVFLTTYFTRFPGPIPPGYINLGDVAIIAAALMLGKNTGFIAGAFGSALADIAAGAYLFVPVTFIVKGLEGFIIGYLGKKHSDNKGNQNVARITAIITGVIVMAAGYFAAEAFILGFFDSSFGMAAALLELPMNLVQAGVSAAAGYLLMTMLPKRLVLE